MWHSTKVEWPIEAVNIQKNSENKIKVWKINLGIFIIQFFVAL
jgi:hypothetical protein